MYTVLYNIIIECTQYYNLTSMTGRQTDGTVTADSDVYTGPQSCTTITHNTLLCTHVRVLRLYAQLSSCERFNYIRFLFSPSQYFRVCTVQSIGDWPSTARGLGSIPVTVFIRPFSSGKAMVRQRLVSNVSHDKQRTSVSNTSLLSPLENVIKLQTRNDTIYKITDTPWVHAKSENPFIDNVRE